MLTDCPDCLEGICKCGSQYRYMRPDDSASVIWAVLRYRSPPERRDVLSRALRDLGCKVEYTVAPTANPAATVDGGSHAATVPANGKDDG